jgi:hypothetical protein
MHDLILALSFLTMLVTPAIVAALSGKREFVPGAEGEIAAPAISTVTMTTSSDRRTRTVAARAVTVSYNVPTLPLHRTLGLANR